MTSVAASIQRIFRRVKSFGDPERSITDFLRVGSHITYPLMAGGIDIAGEISFVSVYAALAKKQSKGWG